MRYNRFIAIIVSTLVFYSIMDYGNDSFFDFYSFKFYKNILLSLGFGIVLNLLIKTNKKST